MGLPVDTPTRKTLRCIKPGIFARLMRIRPGSSRDEQIEALVAVYRAIASPGFPFPEAWVRATATTAHDRSPRDPTSTQRQLAAGRADRMPSISGITAPTLVLHGEADPLVRVAGGRDTAPRIAQACLVTYPGMGHDLPEALWPDVVERVRANAARAARTA